ncbi:MAG: hypothetical protein LIO79_05595 [Rikenellaceae bacterium]|nr:hypothetical protein [Rikenellaceae bacterium]
MKKNLFYLFLFFAVFSNCTKNDKEIDSDYTPVTIKGISDEGVVLASKVGSSATFEVISSQNWTASVKSATQSDVDWMTVYPMQGGSGTTTVTISISSENPLNDERSANIVIGQTAITVIQKGKDALILSKSKWEVDPDGQTIDIVMEHNVDYSIDIPQEYGSWIRKIGTKALESTTLSFEISAITDEDLWTSRSGEFYIIGSGGSDGLVDTVYIYQNQKDRIVASAENEIVSYLGGESILAVTTRSNVDYSYEIIGDPQWIRVGDTPANKSPKVDVVYFTIDPYNEITATNRTAKIAFTNYGNASDTVYVTQYFMDAIVRTRDSYNIDYHSFIFEVVMQTNTDDYSYRFEYEGTQSDWLNPERFEEVKSLPEKSLIFTAKQNFGAARTGKIIFTANASGFEQEVTVTQEAGPELRSSLGPRLMWAARRFNNGTLNASNYTRENSALISWRFMPDDDKGLGFDLYRKAASGDDYVKLNSDPVTNSTNFLDETLNVNEDNHYRLTNASTGEILDELLFTSAMASESYISIPLMPLEAPDAAHPYIVMDVAVGDLTGDGEYELIVKRECDAWMQDVYHQGYSPGETVIEAYKMDGTFMWRVGLGPNISQGKPTSPFAVADFDGDGRCEVLVRSSELTTFGDGTQIGDVNGDGITFYQEEADGRLLSGPEFFSVLDGLTGAELARADYIERGPKEEWAATWGDDWGNRMNRYLVGCGYFDGVDKKPSVLITRGYYAKTVLEAWDFDRATGLTKRWNFTATPNGENSAFAGQGNHQMALGDIDGDGRDDIVYGAMSVDSYGRGMYSSGWGHGDALHLGKFDPNRSGLQIWSCFEDGHKGASFRDAKTGAEIHGFDNPGDVGRALIADIDPNVPGCEMWTSEGDVYDVNGNFLYTIDDIGGSRWGATFYTTNAIWWTGSLNRQFFARTMIDEYIPGSGISRVNTLSFLGVDYTNDTKGTPAFYGDIFGDWREEIIFPSSDHTEIRIISTPHVTEYRFPYLMSDHIYHLSTIHQNVGYNPPTHLGYYLGSDLLK